MFDLTHKEKELVTLLKKVDTRSPWSATIRNVLQEGLNWKIRRLIAELKSQRADNPQVMRLIIGQEAAEKLQAI